MRKLVGRETRNPQMASLELLTANRRLVGVKISDVDNPLGAPRDSFIEGCLYLLVKLQTLKIGCSPKEPTANFSILCVGGGPPLRRGDCWGLIYTTV